MISSADARTGLIWATRGRSWGFRFLLDGGLPDPLPEYERAFHDLEDGPTAWHRRDGKVALRLADPLSRKDTSGRGIPHDFVVVGPLAGLVESAEDGLREVWPLVSSAYARIWDAAAPPSSDDLSFDS